MPDGIVSPPRPKQSPAAFQRDFDSELAWLASLPDLTLSVSRVLAARSGAASTSDPQFQAFRDVKPDRRRLTEACQTLCLLQNDLADHDFDQIDRLWDLSRPLASLLASGGDERLTLDTQTGLNKYGCAPVPRPNVIAYGSCTASSLSESAFACAEAARRRLVASALAKTSIAAVAAATRDIEAAILRVYQAEDLAEIVLTASGTDAALVVTGLLATERPGETITSVLMSPAETGSGVPDAVQGCHFAACTPGGGVVQKGEVIAGLTARHRLLTIPLRTSDGAVRSQTDIAADCDAAIRRGLEHGRVVLHAIDGSKTGLTAPDGGTCERLAETFGNRLDIVIDLCQARVEPDRVRWYLRQGHPVLITGSKFFAAPGFCGAILFPRDRLRRIAGGVAPASGLGLYTQLRDGFGSRLCPGLILRWTAALHEMDAFYELQIPEIRQTLSAAGDMVRQAIARDPRYRLIEAPRPESAGWSGLRSVFTFAIRDGDSWMAPDALRSLYVALGATAPFCQIGQPVELGSKALGGLRLAFSAAQLRPGLDHAEALAVVFGKLGSVSPG